MAAWRRAIELSLTDADTAKLRSIAVSEELAGVMVVTVCRYG